MKLVNWRKRNMYAACEMCSYLSVWCKNISFDAIKWKRVNVLVKDASPGVVLQAVSSSLLWERTKKEKIILSCLSVIMPPCRQLWFGLSRFRDVRFFSVFVCWDYFNSNSVIYIFFYIYMCVYKNSFPIVLDFLKISLPIYCEFLLSSCTKTFFFSCVFCGLSRITTTTDLIIEV